MIIWLFLVNKSNARSKCCIKHAITISSVHMRNNLIVTCQDAKICTIFLYRYFHENSGRF